ncbi:uncharacterized protein LOC130209432 isoform X5 [Pseudoliparis swirei]|uniref:uncharacterized protein LOC130209432 isoform X5 n=1 Tax=Pseudoliparis swirei TaxID=2059687 RepID=UPI0024BD6843|nr:uncharacterized protein LOC130209432 isoform X5 [Pseudoliparis swirei]
MSVKPPGNGEECGSAPPVGSSRELMDLLRNLLWLWVIIVTIFAWIVISLIFVFINKCISRAGKHRSTQNLTANSGSGEPACPAGTCVAGYTMDAWGKWRVVCLAALSVEDVEDIYLFGTLITGFLLFGFGAALAYRKIKETVTAVKSPLRLPDMIDVGQSCWHSDFGIKPSE